MGRHEFDPKYNENNIAKNIFSLINLMYKNREL